MTTAHLITTTGAGTAPARPAAIELAGLRKDFGAVRAVDGIDLTIGQGEIVAFLGPNGAGKTSTLDIVLGLSEPTSGTARVFGLAPEDAIAHGLVSAVMQTGGLLKDLTIRETIEFTARLFPVHNDPAEVMRRAGIDHLADRRVGKCSGGEQQRLRFAMALVSDPELILLDEPTTGMDVTARRAFWETIRTDAAAGRTVVFATHYLEEADAYADRVVLVAKGRIVADGTPAQIRALGAGRTVRAAWPGATADDLALVPGIESADLRGDTVVLQCSDSDAVARHLLTRTPAYDLEIIARGLEDAFLALTSEPASNPHTTTHGA